MWGTVASRQGIWYSHLTLCLTLNFIFGYCFRTCPDLKITLYIFYLLVTWPWRHSEKSLLTKPNTFGVNRKRILCRSIFGIEPIAHFCLFLGYWRSKNSSRDHGIKDEFVSLTKTIVLCTIGKWILCWSILAIEPKADFFPFWGYWPSKDGSREHNVKVEFVSLAKPIVFGTSGKKVLCRLTFP